MARTVIPAGVLSVRCPVCRAAPGRPCTSPRGYLARGHGARVTHWALVEVAEHERAQAADAARTEPVEA